MDIHKLIKKGLIGVYLPLISFVVFCGWIANWFANQQLESDTADFIVALAILIAIGIGWIWWSYKIVIWKCNSFSKVKPKEAIALYKKAIDVGLIWKTGSVFNKTEIWTEASKKSWQEIDPEIRRIFKT